METDIYQLRYDSLQRFMFVTFEGFTFQPDSEASEPDIENMQVIGTATGYSRQEAYDTLIKESEFLLETTFNEIWCFRLADGGNYDCMFSLEQAREKETNI